MNNNNDLNSQARRQFMGKLAGVSALALAPGFVLHQVAQAKAPDEAVTNKVRWGILINTNKCASGCNDCVSACENEHAWGSASANESLSSPEQKAQWIRKVTLTDKKTGHVNSLPLMCQHCETAPCVDVCPTGASLKREDGIVLVDKHLCIGCRYCMMACPYKARSFIHETLTDQSVNAPRGVGTVESCTLCVHRVDEGETPACVEACSTAMIFGDLNDPKSNISVELKQNGGEQIRADLGLNTGVRYQGL